MEIIVSDDGSKDGTLEVLKENIHDNNLRALFLSGSGDSFSAGGDVKDMASREDLSNLQEKTENLIGWAPRQKN